MSLTPWQAVKQSWMIHPDWNVATHLQYLRQEGYDVDAMVSGGTDQVGRWLTGLTGDFRRCEQRVSDGKPCTNCGARWFDSVLEHADDCEYCAVANQAHLVAHQCEEAIARGDACTACGAAWTSRDGPGGWHRMGREQRELKHASGCTYMALLWLLDDEDMAMPPPAGVWTKA